MEPFPVQCPKVFEPQLSPRGWDADLPSVQVPRESQVELIRLEPTDDVRKVAQQDPEVSLRIHKGTGPSPAAKRHRIDSDDLESCRTDLE
jgi:hypothetical protein